MATLNRILLLILLSSFLLAAAGATVASQGTPNCSHVCGNVSIPYPFGTSEDCYLNEDFLVTCSSAKTPPELTLGWRGNLVVTNISLDGHLEVLQYVAKDCYDASGRVDRNNPWLRAGSRFTVSNEKNNFFAIGCDTTATISNDEKSDGVHFRTGCMANCDEQDINSTLDDSCSGVGCCRVTFPRGLNLKFINISLSSNLNHKYVYKFNPCSYAFITDPTQFRFEGSKSFSDFNQTEQLPLVLDWTIANENCNEAKNKTNYACKDKNSACKRKNRSAGYLCNCKDGYLGNPYLAGGCTDIDECETLKPCNHGMCVNTPGSYYCSCPTGFEGDLRNNGTGCSRIPDHHHRTVPVIPLGICFGVGFLFLVVGIWWLYRQLERRKNIKIKENFFKRNGGLLFKKKVNSNVGGVEITKLFTSKELERATDQFNENRIIGRGGQGVVYKGMLQDGRTVAVKKAKVVSDGYLEQFINEIIILSQIDHRNVVRLLGCCLETEVPLLVYEFIPNGTLFHLIHDQNEEYPRLWDTRLRIATEVASAIFYLHSSASVPIYHRDIKSNNILLDEKFRAKVSDFGTSRSVSIDQTHLTIQVQGTFGYVDPEYFRSHHFTEKSDVYSFGVVLVELLTGQKPIMTSESQEKRGLVDYFIQCMDENNLLNSLDSEVVKSNHSEELLAVAHLARRCLNSDGRYRPTMKEVHMELEKIRGLQGHIHVKQPQEDEIAITKPTENWEFTSSSTGSCMNFTTTSM